MKMLLADYRDYRTRPMISNNKHYAADLSVKELDNNTNYEIDFTYK